MSVGLDLDLLKTIGQVAAPAGIAIGAFLFIARDLVAKNIFPTLPKKHVSNVIIALVFMAGTVALAGIVSWTYVETHRHNGDVGNSSNNNINSGDKNSNGNNNNGDNNINNKGDANNDNPPKSTVLPPLPGGTGWVFAGYFNVERNTFIEGPYIAIHSTTTIVTRRFVEIGDIIELKVSRDIHIVDFQKTGADKKFVSPAVKGIIDEYDKTGITLPAKTQLIVRDTSESREPPDNPNAALWLRVAYIPQ